jgi:hypothetical protein
MPPRQCTKIKTDIAKPPKRICIPISREEYAEIFDDRQRFRAMLDGFLAMYPELFPPEIGQGYQLYGLRQQSIKMPDVKLRRICLNVPDEQERLQVYTIAPSFVLPYMTGYADDVEKALYLRRYGVPFSALTYVFGRNDMYWQRLVALFGRNDIVGTTVKDPELLPDHLLADEKHTRWNDVKAYIATTVADDCVLGASLALAADEEQLTTAYGQFKEEVLRLNPDYQPKTVNTDGWSATQLAWKALFPTIVIIQCFLHAFITIRSRCKRLKTLFPVIRQQVWDIYHADRISVFRERIQDLQTWAQCNLTGYPLESVLKLCGKSDLFALAFEYPDAHRTSNMLDRHMEPMDRCLHSARYFHGHLMSGEHQIRAWALFHNFQPYCPRAKIRQKYVSPFHKLNGFVYHDNWLQNLLVASSLGGRYATNTIR